MREYVNRGGTVYAKYKVINDKVLEQFYDFWSQDLEIHDKDLEEWALLAAEKVGMPEFKASHTWIGIFKRRNKIVFRHVTKLAGKKRRDDASNIDDAIDSFMADVQSLIKGDQQIPPELVG